MAESHPAGSGSPQSKTLGDPQMRFPYRKPPPMRVVTKGWWTLTEGEADIEELRKEDQK